MRLRRAPTSMLAIAAIGVASSGCSALFAGGHTPETCSSDYAPVVVDVLLGVVALGTGATGVVVGSMLDDGAGISALGVVGVAGGIGHFVSAATNRVGRCRRSQTNLTPGLWDLGEPKPDPRRASNDLRVALGGHYRYEVGSYREVETVGGTADVAVSFKGRAQLGIAVSYGDYDEHVDDLVEDDARYRLTSLAPRLVVEIIERTPDVFGVGVRVRPSWGWSTYVEGGRDSPGGWPLIALVMGTTDVWLDLGGGETTALDDPRYAHLELGFRAGIVDVQFGGAVVGHREFGAFVFMSHLDFSLSERWTLATRFEIGGVFGMSAGLAYRFSP